MKMRKIAIISGLLLLSSMALAQQKDLKTKTFYLENGLKVVMCEDHSQPEIYGAVFVHAGSKNDPADATGMAHYFEHIMFKGTDKIGTTNWEAEKVYLDSIALMYDKLNETADAEERAAIQRKINELSLASTEYAIPNEVDVVLTKMGGKGLNAGTSYDQTVYFNTFPSNQLSKWMDVYVERFRYPVFRLFQSELETVYEEKNMYGDQPTTAFTEYMFKESCGDHPYGRPIIGYTEHLKNPQPNKMREFYETYYVANNMTLILVGDFDIDSTEPLVREKFAVWRKGDLPKMPEYHFPDFNGPTVKEVRMTPIKMGCLIFPGVKNNDPDCLPLTLACMVFSNGQTGLMDKLMLNGDIMAAMLMPMSLEDAGSNIIIYIPKLLFQSHKAAEKHVFNCLEQLKKGDFSDDLFEAVRMQLLVENIKQTESFSGLSGLFLELESTRQSYADYLANVERLKSITKEEVVAVANKYFGNDYIDVRSKMGFPAKDKVEKPDWKPIEAKNTNEKSDFAKAVEAEIVPEVQPQVIQFGEDVKITEVNEHFKLYSTANTRNDIFNLCIAYNHGTLADPDLDRAVSYFSLQGTGDMSFDAFSLQLQKMGAEISLSCTDDELNVYITGFEKDMETILALCREKLFNPSNDESKKKILVEEEMSGFTMMREDASTWAKAVREYALYGENSSYLNHATLKQWKKRSGKELLEEVTTALQFDGYVTFTGNTESEKVAKMLNDNGLVKLDAQKGEKKCLKAQKFDAPQVFVASNKQFRQSNIYFHVGGEKLNLKDEAMSSVFNKYFGTDMYSIVFQEIREFRSLGYTAYGAYSYNAIKKQPGYLRCFLGTQSDKTIDGISALRGLIVDMPERMEKFNASKEALLLSRASNYIGFRSMPSTVHSWEEQGFDHDPRLEFTEMIRGAKYEDIYDFYTRMVKNRPVIIMMSGNLKQINATDLEQYGKVTVVGYEDIIKE